MSYRFMNDRELIVDVEKERRNGYRVGQLHASEGLPCVVQCHWTEFYADGYLDGWRKQRSWLRGEDDVFVAEHGW